MEHLHVPQAACLAQPATQPATKAILAALPPAVVLTAAGRQWQGQPANLVRLFVACAILSSSTCSSAGGVACYCASIVNASDRCPLMSLMLHRVSVTCCMHVLPSAAFSLHTPAALFLCVLGKYSVTCNTLPPDSPDGTLNIYGCQTPVNAFASCVGLCQPGYTGNLIAVCNAGGSWDVTSYCVPGGLSLCTCGCATDIGIAHPQSSYYCESSS